MIRSDMLRFFKRLVELVGLRAEALGKANAPVLTGQLRSGIAFQRVGDFRGKVETSRITRSYAGVQERRVGYMRRAAQGVRREMNRLADRAWRETVR